MNNVFKTYKLINKEISKNLNSFQKNFCSFSNLNNESLNFKVDENQFKYFDDVLENIRKKNLSSDKEFKAEVAKVYKKIPTNFKNVSKEKIDIIEKEIKLILNNSLFGPKYFTENDISDLDALWDDEKSRKHFIAYIGSKQFKRFRTKFFKKHKKVIEKEEIPELHRIENEDSTIFYKKKRRNYVYEKNLWSSAIDGQNIILDFAFSNDLLKSSNVNLVSQLQRLIKFNEQSDKPFNVWFTSYNKELQIHNFLQKNNLFSPKHFINQREKHFIDIFPKDKLVYLSPDAEENIDKFDNQAIYIIGAIIDRHENEALTYNCAKKLGIKSLKLPLKENVILSDLSIDLSCFNVFQMLNFMQYSYAKWENAFRMYLPRDRKKSDLEIISKSNSPFVKFNEKSIEKYNNMIYYTYKNKLFKKLKTQK